MGAQVFFLPVMATGMSGYKVLKLYINRFAERVSSLSGL